MKGFQLFSLAYIWPSSPEKLLILTRKKETTKLVPPPKKKKRSWVSGMAWRASGSGGPVDATKRGSGEAEREVPREQDRVYQLLRERKRDKLMQTLRLRHRSAMTRKCHLKATFACNVPSLSHPARSHRPTPTPANELDSAVFLSLLHLLLHLKKRARDKTLLA